MIAMSSISPIVPGLSSGGQPPAEDATVAAAFGAVMASLTPSAGASASPPPATPVIRTQPAVIARSAGDGDAPGGEADAKAADDAATAEDATGVTTDAVPAPTVMTLPVTVAPVAPMVVTVSGEGVRSSAAARDAATNPMAGSRSGRTALPGPVATPGITMQVSLPQPLAGPDVREGVPDGGGLDRAGLSAAGALDTPRLASADGRSSPSAVTGARPAPRGVAGPEVGATDMGAVPPVAGVPAGSQTDRIIADGRGSGAVLPSGQMTFAAASDAGSAPVAGSLPFAAAVLDPAMTTPDVPRPLVADGGATMPAIGVRGGRASAGKGGDAPVVASAIDPSAGSAIGAPEAGSIGAPIADAVGGSAATSVDPQGADVIGMLVANVTGTKVTGTPVAGTSGMALTDAIGTPVRGAMVAPLAIMTGTSVGSASDTPFTAGDGMLAASDAPGTIPSALSVAQPAGSATGGEPVPAITANAPAADAAAAVGMIPVGLSPDARATVSAGAGPVSSPAATSVPGLSAFGPGATGGATSPFAAGGESGTTAMTGLDLDAMFPLAGTAPLTVSFTRTPHAVALATAPVADTVAAGDLLADLAQPDDDASSFLPAGLAVAAPAVTPATTIGTAATGPAAAAPADAGLQHHLDVAHDGAWLDRLAHDIAASADRDQKMRFQLNPERLGSLQVEIAGGSDGASVRFTADSEAARALIADAQPRLVAEARAQGMRIADTQVDLSGRNGGQGGGQSGANPFAQGQGQGQQQGGGQRAPLFDRPTTNRPITRAGAVTAGAERYA
ncbi:flagellar hook-length control protein FliK [Sphingomonas solaris]|uniref:Flagellar hook-length control protein-like C-terminal domain-containing protein n=1 Tax=Alterirhizorhabdus solaris TaxID=2529389 RepID=A0A558R1C0_9SPHN|nr:flagellar hook-length control protein FliK [Sphingomonas solaris]TVV73173.1 hypothetical protein FOY91_12845 [Sphingomonas solaris]